MGRKNEELRGVYVGHKFASEYDDGNWYIVAKLADGTIVVGNSSPKEFVAGQEYIFYGYWKEHHTYGMQFSFSSAAMQKPATHSAILKYLAAAPNIGSARAAKLLKKHGTEAVDAAKIASNLIEVGMTESRADEAATWFVRQSKDQETKLQLTELLGGLSMPRSLISELIKQFGVQAPDLISENPFILFSWKNIGFKKCDAIWDRLKKPRNSILRGRYCILYSLQQANDGSTWYAANQVKCEAMMHIGTNDISVDECIESAEEFELIVKREDDDGTWYAEFSKGMNEGSLAHRVVDLDCSYDIDCGVRGDLIWPDVRSIRNLSDHQREQLLIALSGPIGILTGGPGCGKTYTIARLVESLLKLGGGIAISAPTGKAAVRATEALMFEGIDCSAFQPRTMHRQLEFRPQGFLRNERSPLDQRFHILDEQSMVTTDLLNSYIKAVKHGAHVLLVCDPHQLPPVGHGRPVLDLIRYGIPCGVLSEPRRNCGKIVKCCHLIRSQREFESSHILDVEHGDNLFFTHSRKTDEFYDELDRWLDECMDMGLDLNRDVQVISPMNNRGDLSCDPINELIQKKLNPGPRIDSWMFKINDKVICTKNGWYQLINAKTGKADGTTYIANGEQGTVLSVEKKYCLVNMHYPHRTVRFTPSDPVQTAWCITCHKSQGSEWPATLVLFDPGFDRGGTSEWVTTAISRAKKFCIGIGSPDTAAKWVRKTGLFNRKTLLQQRMMEFAQFTFSE